MLSFDDAVTAANLPAGQKFGVYYVDGRFANHGAVQSRLGADAKLLGITVFGAVGKGIQICDCENGDLTAAQAIAWVADSLKAGVYRPCVYANESTWKGGLEAALAHHGGQIRRWIALYDGGPAVPGGYDAKQYLGDVGGVDKNVALDTFFDTAAAKPEPQPKPPVLKPSVPDGSQAVQPKETPVLQPSVPDGSQAVQP
jgi:hypothetical protein